MAAIMAMIANRENFPRNARFFSILKAVQNRKKVTKKSMTDCISSLGLFSGKGHLIWSRNDAELTPALRTAYALTDDVQGRIVDVFVTGGMHPRMPLTTTTASIFSYTFHIQESDIKVLQVTEKKCTGAQISMRPFIHSANIVFHTRTRDVSVRRIGSVASAAAVKTSVYIWGGIDPNIAMVPHNDLIVLENFGRGFNAKLIGTSDTVSLQTGSVPSPRYGHSLTLMNKEGKEVGAILYGGVGCVEKGGNHATIDGKMYWLDMEKYHWQEIIIQGQQDLPPVAFHTGNEIKDCTVVYLGGLLQVQEDNKTVIRRMSILDVSIIQCHLPQEGQNGIRAVISKIQLTFAGGLVNILLSGHTTNVCSPSELLVYGGYQQVDNEIHSTVPSGQYFIVNIATASVTLMTAPPGFEMASHTSIPLDSSSVFFHGGANQHLFTLTTKKMDPGRCEAETCVVDSEYTPGELVRSLQCVRCDKLFHVCCTEEFRHSDQGKLDNIDFLCHNCKPKKTKGRKKQRK